jgi:hypothetical protein
MSNDSMSDKLKAEAHEASEKAQADAKAARAKIDQAQAKVKANFEKS